LPTGAAVRIDMNDSTLMGEIAGCSSIAAQNFLACVNVREAVPTLSDLGRLITAVMNASHPNEFSATPLVRESRTAAAN